MFEGPAAYECGKCGYEFLSKIQSPVCPKCESSSFQRMDKRVLVGLDG